MPLNNITFDTVAGGLGRLPAGEDHVSALILPLGSTPGTWTDNRGKRYLSLEEAEADGFLESGANKLYYYYISEYFRMAGPSELFLMDETHFDYEGFLEVTGGRVRQIAIMVQSPTAIIAAIDSYKLFATFLNNNYAPAVLILGHPSQASPFAPYPGTMPDIMVKNVPEISVLISGDGSGLGKELANDINVSYYPGVTAVLGALSRAKVHENIGWVGKFPLSEGKEYQDVLLSTGDVVRGTAVATLNKLNDASYMFMRNIQGISGCYIHDTPTCTPVTSDFHYIENVRTIQKAKRNIRTSLLPDLNSPIEVDANGMLSPDTVAYFTNQTSRPLNLMLNAGEVSAFSVYIDPDQNVLSDSTLHIQVKIVPRGVARQIVISIGYAVSIN